MAINLDAYYRGLAAEELQRLGDRLLVLSREAEGARAHSAALHLAEASTELLELGMSVGGLRTSHDPGDPL